MKDLNEILKNNGITPLKEESPLDARFAHPLEQLEDLFESFGRIFKPMEEKMIINELTSGVTCRFKDGGGTIFVSTDSEKNFIPYVDMFIPIKNKK